MLESWLERVRIDPEHTARTGDRPGQAASLGEGVRRGASQAGPSGPSGPSDRPGIGERTDTVGQSTTGSPHAADEVNSWQDGDSGPARMDMTNAFEVDRKMAEREVTGTGSNRGRPCPSRRGRTGRRYATEQINHAYTTLLSSQFQGFARDLHSECVDHIVTGVPVEYETILRTLLLRDRKLDKGNPNPGNLGADFGRFGFNFWSEVQVDHHGNDRRQESLAELNEWRNAIAHQDFDATRLGGTTTLHLHTVRAWRRALNRLAQSFDNVMRDQIN